MRKLITSALPYVNNVPHLGNIIGCVLSADVYARFCRARGYETLYICGNDEYGTATENKAREEGLTPRQICDKYHAIHDRIYRDFHISFDTFGRTSTEEQTRIAQDIFLDLDANGMISEQSSERTYCDHDAMFLADRYVEGTCPHCQYEDARGDQCDRCGRLLEPEKLLKPRCKFCGNAPNRRETKHLYLDLDRLQERLQKWFSESSTAGKWSNNAIQTTHGWLERGLEPRPITRDLKWGIPVPKPGYENKVFYVWYDAPIGYISITAKLLPDTWKSWWQNPAEVQLYQFMAKDNIPFHTVIFPASLIGTNRDWTLLHHINSTEYLNYEDAKFSKSRGIGVFGTDVMTVGLPFDLWRFYLLLVRPEKTDSVFSWTEFYERVNSDFINNIGNLVNRATFLYKFFEGELHDGVLNAEQQAFVAGCRADLDEITESLEAVRLRDGLRQVLALGNRANKFVQDSQPWVQIKDDPRLAQTTASLLVYAVRAIAVVLEPYMPLTAERIRAMLQLGPQTWADAYAFEGLNGHRIAQPEILYRNLDPKDAEKWRKKFSGNAPDFARFRIKVGRIEAIANHPEAEHLYVMQVDLGEAEPRTIVAGLTKHYEAEQLRGRKVMVLANLEPADLRGVQSQGMVLACEKRNKLELLEADSFELGQEASCEEVVAAAGQVTIDEFKNAPFRIEGGKVLFDGAPVVIGGQTLGPATLETGKLK